MLNLNLMTKRLIVILIIVLLAIFGIGFWIEKSNAPTVEPGDTEVSNFQECIQAGNPVMESYPRQCRSKAGKTFVEESCSKAEEGEILTLTDAQKIARESECGDRLTGEYFCNQNSGTWWLDLDINKEGCNPACVVNVVTREAEINWRCTGLIEPEK